MTTAHNKRWRSAVIAGFFTLVATILATTGMWADGRMWPKWVEWKHVEESVDLNRDHKPETITVTARHLTITDADKNVCSAPSDWLVSDVAVADINHDERQELIILAWRRGSFGPSHPFWRTEADRSFTQHIFIAHYEDHQISPLWMSSDVGAQISALQVDELGRVLLKESTGQTSLWEWQDFGLVLIEDATAPESSFGSPLPPARPAASFSPSNSEQTLSNPSAWDAPPAQDNCVSLIAVGDNLAHESVYMSMYDKQTDSYNFSPLYSSIAPYISSYDLAAVQQETILVHDPALYSSYPRFGTPLAMADALAETGFNIICSASNHSFDQGETGLKDTLEYYREHYPTLSVLGIQMPHQDASHFTIRECRGMRIALFNYTYGLNGLTLPANLQSSIDQSTYTEQVIEDLASAEQEADISVFFLHMGEEYATEPTEEQRAYVEMLIDAGADCIICTHAHIAQPVEQLRTSAGNTALVYWCLGNFMSHMTERPCILGGAARVVFERNENGDVSISQWDYLPLVCHFGGGSTRVYALSDYSDELALTHTLSTLEDPLTCQALYEQWKELTHATN